ncbi:hypothetical protein [Actinospica robiniae]|uniref:hypothetical protein n=1 Tax=Actinospica robiniae TaxID=304901 RepID=UPI00041BD67D|nr:hypothetical protein [Actinospica robiniae]
MSDQGSTTGTGQGGWSGHSAQSGKAEGWKERCDVLAGEINHLLRSGAGANARAREAELFELLRVHSSARLAADTLHTIARHHYAAGDTVSALSAFRDARAGYLEVSDSDGLSEVDRGTALIHAGALEWGRAVATLHASARDLMELGATEKAARAHISAAAFRTVGGRISDAEPELDTADRLLRSAAIDLWYETGEASVACQSCGQNSDLRAWRWADDYFAFGYLGFEFWDWPDLAAGFVDDLAQVLDGHRMIRVRGKL